MSKSTLAIIAALSAGAGAAATAAAFSLRSQRKSDLPVATTTASTIMTTGATAKVPAPVRPVDPAGLYQYGFPGPVVDITARQALLSAYDRRLRNPHWVAEHMTPMSVAQRGGDRKHSAFLEDPAVPDRFRARLKDYFRSGYDRGHQVPAADARWSQAAMDETFYLTNMCPQVGDGFNRDYWAHFEDFCRRLTQRYPSVRVATGPLYLPRRDPQDGKWYTRYEVIGEPPSVAVPTHFYKVIYAEEQPFAPGPGPGSSAPGNVALGAFVLPNAPIPNDKPLADFEVPLEAVERASGLEFASALPVHRRRRLCADTPCSLLVREFGERQKQPAREGSRGR